MDFNNIIRQGLVDSVDAKNYTCNVYFPDQDVLVTNLTIRTNGTRNQERNLPNVNDLALCIFIPPSLSDGWVIAFGYNDEDQPPEGDENTYITKFPDGSLIRYQKGVIDVQAKSSVNITAPTINISGKLIINKEPYLEHTHKSGLYKDGDSKPVSGTSGTIS